jgi:hypothetical protein
MVEDSDAGNNGVGGGITKRIRWDLEFNVGVWDGCSMHCMIEKGKCILEVHQWFLAGPRFERSFGHGKGEGSLTLHQGLTQATHATQADGLLV